MKPVLELKTERLLLRSIQLEDAAAIFSYRSDEVANQYQGWIPKIVDDVINFIQNKVSSEIDVIGTWHQLVIINSDNNKLIGDVGIHFFDPNKKQVEIGFTINKIYQGKGFATEAAKAIISFLFEHLNKHRITASIDPNNIQSIRLVERLGFRKEAHFRKSIFMDGKWVDDLVYAMLKEDW